MVFAAKRQGARGDANFRRCDACGFGKAQQRRLVGEDELQHAGEETRLHGGAADLMGLDAGDGKKTRQKLWIGGDEAERLDCQRLGAFPVLLAFQHYISSIGLDPE